MTTNGVCSLYIANNIDPDHTAPLTLYLKETHFNTFTDKADPDQAALVIAAESGLWKYDRYDTYDPTLFFVLRMYKRESLFIQLFIVGGT